MANKSIYIRDEDLPVFEKAQKIGKESISSLIMDALKNYVSSEEEKNRLWEEKKRAKGWLENLLEKALQSMASDVFLRPTLQEPKAFFRIDGIFQEVSSIPAEYYSSLVDLIAEESERDFSKRELPIVRGRISRKINDRRVEMRITILPSALGPAVSFRILEKDPQLPGLEDLEPEGDHAEELREFAKMSRGLVLITGPNGSGKTTTAYGLLKAIDGKKVNMITSEDPVEALLEDVVQIPVNSSQGGRFPDVIRAIYQSDPDVIYVGEIRDKESALLTAQGALTGHLVFSILHSPTVVSAYTRLYHVGLPSFMVRDSVVGVVAQRLARKLCQHCKEEDLQSYPEVKEVLESRKHITGEEKFFTSKGCKECNHTGFRGRLSLFEVLKPGPKFKKAFMDGAPEEELQKIAQKEGMKTLLEDGVRKAARGFISLSEVLRVLIQ